MLEVKNVYTGYDKKEIIKDINFSIKRGENLCIVGPNGCGKSTLLKSIANILDYKGSIKIDGQEVSEFNRLELAKKVGLMSQMTQLHFPYSVYDTVSLGRYAYSKGAFSRLSQEDVEIVVDSMKKVGVYELKDRMITELSGGQLQRVLLARVFAQNPDIILLDEPTNHLDFKHQVELLDNLNHWVKDNNKIVIGVLHDLNLVQYFADRVLILKEGKEVNYGLPKDVFSGKTLNEVYEIDIRGFMKNILKKWD